ncbi:MAG: serine/threonine protein kinase [Acidobacteriota bacterium]|nr:MAG: serine/threonine protein kinase [Acidobacteriota bacterium]
MGEVYRADDLQLGQSVALKFLPVHLSADPTALARLRNEVRVARQISHPNVCRVYDLGEAEGQYFIAMEYVDGEDLRSVLRRLGRPTGEKALEIARELCAGLAAAHRAGVLHRDLKPANIMIDGRGRVRITDFGLAGFARELPRDDSAGTPAYMAPEQFSGSESSTRTDLYALGAVLYELFTGQRAFDADSVSGLRRLQRTASLTAPSHLVDGMDPVAEQVIVQCLEMDPRARPSSALDVAAKLPGGDPVTAALAAGETPSPEMVAAAGGEGALRPTIAIACLMAIIAGMLAIAALNERVALFRLAPPAKPAVVLADRAREILTRLGHDSKPLDVAYRYEAYDGYLEHVRDTDARLTRWQRLSHRRPSVYWFWYRESPAPLVASNSIGAIRFHDPPLTTPGMVGVKIDHEGRLAVLVVVPPQVDIESSPTDSSIHGQLFEAAGLDLADFQETEPRWNPGIYAEERAAWVGHYPRQEDWPLRVEAAFYGGRPVYFQVIESFDEPREGWLDDQRSFVESAGEWAKTWLLVIALVVPAVLARRNLRRGNGDRRGAMRLGVVVWLLSLLTWLFYADHTSKIDAEVNLFIVNLSVAVLMGFWTGLVYLALEPYVRRLWPETLVSWTRLLMGRIRDPRVGRDILLGALAGVVVIVLQRLEWLVPPLLGVAPSIPCGACSEALLGGTKPLADLLHPKLLADPLFILLFLTIFRFVLRKRRLAVAGAFVFFVLLDSHWYPDHLAGAAIGSALIQVLLVWSLLLLLLTRAGLLSLVSAFFFSRVLQCWPVTLDVSAWYAGSSLTLLALLGAVATLAMFSSLGSDSRLNVRSMR